MEQNRLVNLRTARQRLAERRSSIIEVLARAFQREQSDAHIDMMIKIHTAIEVIDKAIAEEEHSAQQPR
jgi:hypothetical protein